MAFDLWTHQFCLACDKQVQSDGAAYCSEACRLADHERTSTASSQAGSPGFAPAGHGGLLATTTTPTELRSIRSNLCLPATYHLYGQSRHEAAPPESHSMSKYALSYGLGEQSNTPSTSVSMLTPSSSHSSLCSMQSTSSADATHLSDRSRQELKAYAISFEQVRLQRRQSY